MQPIDLQILEKLKKGNPKAFKELFNLYYMPLCIYSLKYCDSFQLAEDIVQDLFVQIWDKKLYMKLEEAISPYLFKAVKNNTLHKIFSYPSTTINIQAEPRVLGKITASTSVNSTAIFATPKHIYSLKDNEEFKQINISHNIFFCVDEFNQIVHHF